MIYVVLIALYVIPFLLNWKYFNLAYSKKGIYSGLNPDFIDLFLTIIPLINIVSSLQWIIRFPIKLEVDFSKFFRIKK